MPRKNSKRPPGKSKFTEGFRILNGPIVPQDREEGRDVGDFDDVGLPRVHGAPMLFAIARDPCTIFTCWSVDWPTVFAKTVPVDRQVHLRVYRADEVEARDVAVEPMAGYCYIAIPRPNGFYHVEIGYYQPADVWHSVAVSDEVRMPPHRVAAREDFDLVTIPLHLRFQRLLDLFGASNGDALAEIVSQFQKRALSDQVHTKLSPEERKLLRAMDLSLFELAAARREFTPNADSETLRKRREALLSFGQTSSSPGFGGRMWSSGAP